MRTQHIQTYTQSSWRARGLHAHEAAFTHTHTCVCAHMYIHISIQTHPWVRAQFLEALLDKGVTGIVRVGGRSRSERLGPLNLRELARQGVRQRLSSSEMRQRGRLREEQEELDGKRRRLGQLLASVLTCGMVGGMRSGEQLEIAMAATDALWVPRVRSAQRQAEAREQQQRAARARRGPQEERDQAEQAEQAAAAAAQKQWRALKEWEEKVVRQLEVHLQAEQPEMHQQLCWTSGQQSLRRWLSGDGWVECGMAVGLPSESAAAVTAAAIAMSGSASALGPEYLSFHWAWMRAGAAGLGVHVISRVQVRQIWMRAQHVQCRRGRAGCACSRCSVGAAGLDESAACAV